MEETKIDNLIVHVPTKLKYWEDEMVEADFLGEEKDIIMQQICI